MSEIIYIALFSVWITGWFTPFNPAREYITDKWVRLCIKLKVPTLANAIVVLSCPKCFGLWFTLIYKQSFTLALSVSFTAFLINFVIQEIEKISNK